MKNLPIWAIGVWLVILTCWLLMGCKTKSVTEYVAVHDTLRTVQTDTVRDVRVVTKTDTIHQTESHLLTVNERGDTIREVHVYHEREKTVVVDSTNRYQSKIDSLQAVIDKSREQTTIKEPPWWERWGRKIGFAVVVLLLLMLILRQLKRAHVIDKTEHR